jgi:hypothetical protein
MARDECGRQPRIDPKPGRRDHGPSVNFAVITGGGPGMGQVISEIDALSRTIKERSLTPQNVLARVEGVPGINRAQTLPDYRSRLYSISSTAVKLGRNYYMH